MDKTRYRVLLIEDDKIDQAAFKRLVADQELPYDCTIAGSVSEARSILASESFDIVIIDYLLGDGTAFDVLDLIVDTPIIIATGTGNEELAVRAMKAGAYDYLIKDLARNYLKAVPVTVANAIRHKKAERELEKYHHNLEVLVSRRTEELAEEKELLSVTLASMSDAVIVVDAEKRVMLLNKAAENLVGWEFREAQGRGIDEVFQVIDEQTRSPVESPIDKVLNSGQIAPGGDRDVLITTAGERPISATAGPIHKSDGTMVGVVMVLRDVAREREIDRMKTDFVSSVSHELRTPLASIKEYTATILRDPDMPEKTRRQFLAIIDEESDRLTKLIEALLEISRIESAPSCLWPEAGGQSVDIAAVIEQVLSDLRPLAAGKNIRLKTDIADGLALLQGQGSRIRAVVANLIENAIKFTPQKGRVSISARRQDDELLIRVGDTGMGIPADDLPKVFGRFYRVHQPGRQIQGTGLGLAIVEKIVTMHGGRIEVESEPGKGTTFTVFLPGLASPRGGVNVPPSVTKESNTV